VPTTPVNPSSGGVDAAPRSEVTTAGTQEDPATADVPPTPESLSLGVVTTAGDASASQGQVVPSPGGDGASQGQVMPSAGESMPTSALNVGPAPKALS